MRQSSANIQRVLAIELNSKGFGFAILEKPARLIEYGFKRIKADKNITCLKRIDGLIKHFQPDVIVLRDSTSKDFRRSPRIQELTQEILKLALSKRIGARVFSRIYITKAFSSSGTFTKYQIANCIAERLPELAFKLPPPRMLWVSEDERMSIFDSVALALRLLSNP